MRHKIKGRKFGKEKKVREPFLLSIVQGLIVYGSIKTTLARAKEIRSIAEKFITKAKQDNFNTRRYLRKFFSPEIVNRLISLGASFKNLNGGYTQILKLSRRRTDAAPMAQIRLITIEKVKNESTTYENSASKN